MKVVSQHEMVALILKNLYKESKKRNIQLTERDKEVMKISIHSTIDFLLENNVLKTNENGWLTQRKKE